jgi:hypothetical protein
MHTLLATLCFTMAFLQFNVNLTHAGETTTPCFLSVICDGFCADPSVFTCSQDTSRGGCDCYGLA